MFGDRYSEVKDIGRMSDAGVTAPSNAMGPCGQGLVRAGHDGGYEA